VKSIDNKAGEMSILERKLRKKLSLIIHQMGGEKRGNKKDNQRGAGNNKKRTFFEQAEIDKSKAAADEIDAKAPVTEE